MRYFIVAGEASGDLHASNLMKAIIQLDEQATFAFVGGEKMAEVCKTTPSVHYRNIAYMGIINVLKHLPAIHSAARKMQEAMLHFCPDHVIAIDASSFCMRYLLPFAEEHFPTAIRSYYILPKVWSSRKGRIKKLHRLCHNLFAIFPFEEDFFAREGAVATFVGNPCVEAVGSYSDTHTTKEKPKTIALLPGSRLQEIRENLPTMIAAVATYFPQYQASIAMAPGIAKEFYTSFIPKDKNILLSNTSTYTLLSTAQMAVITSGTATLEAALIGTPTVAVYRSKGWFIINWLFRHMLPIRYITPVNLIANERVIPELLSAEATAANIASALQEVTLHALTVKRGYTKIRELLQEKKASIEVAQALQRQSPHQ